MVNGTELAEPVYESRFACTGPSTPLHESRFACTCLSTSQGTGGSAGNGDPSLSVNLYSKARMSFIVSYHLICRIPYQSGFNGRGNGVVVEVLSLQRCFALAVQSDFNGRGNGVIVEVLSLERFFALTAHVSPPPFDVDRLSSELLVSQLFAPKMVNRC
ncbi:hypothetical protein GOP47_0025355 [Adiantum capillus-veneris]|uniref:Uncharacterized protein n=1 Tax=Adiantum capillus-veneris TaxID=13818 RepID=A0A9D4Z415_ADICA|nr:hypothetical protein GOP47_0025355 [Adiantum capillus-veneris]